MGETEGGQPLGLEPWHPRLANDVHHILRRHGPSRGKAERRRGVIKTLDGIVKHSSGNRFKIIDLSSDTYAQSTDECEIHLAWEDTESSSKEEIPLPEYFTRPPALFELLEKALIKTTHVFPYPSTSKDFVVPPIAATFADMPLCIHPPSASFKRLRDLFLVYTGYFPMLEKVLPFLNLWMRSHGITAAEISESALALMTVAFLRECFDVPYLKIKQGAIPPAPKRVDRAPRTNGRPLTGKEEGGGKLHMHLPQPLRSTTMGKILHEFFKFWGENVKPEHQIVSIRYHPWQRRENESDNKEEAGELLIGRQPRYWESASMVVQDPFFLTYNHTQSLSEAQWDRFNLACKTSAQNVEQGSPVHVIFGSHLKAFPVEVPIPASIGVRVEVECICGMQAPDQMILIAREQTRRRVSEVPRESFGQLYFVQTFGSTVYRADSARSDLDMVILDAERPLGCSPDDSPLFQPPIYDMNLIQMAFQRAGFLHVRAIPKATVPIVKFLDPATGLQVDLNCNHRLGLVNTALLQTYCNLWPPLRLMIFFVKMWAKSWSLNDPSGSKGPASFSSYCLALMCVGFLQHKGVLPNLQEDASQPVDRDTSGFWINSRNHKHVWCDTRFQAPRYWQGAPLLLEDAIYGWFRFFACEHRYEGEALDIKNGGLVVRPRPPMKDPESNLASVHQLLASNFQTTPTPITQPEEWDKSRLVVVDPFIRDKNCASACTTRGLDSFQHECQRAMSLLEVGHLPSQLLRTEVPSPQNNRMTERANHGFPGPGSGPQANPKRPFFGAQHGYQGIPLLPMDMYS